MQIKEALTFDDILLVPNKSNILPNETDTQTLITSRISLNSPIMSSAMDLSLIHISEPTRPY